jgi:methionyl-tRNA formyltransferase
MTRTVFMGTPDFAVASLKALIAAPQFELVGAVTQPDRPSGRGQHLTASPVKQEAKKYEIPLFQPDTLKTEEAVATLALWQPDLIVVVAFGQILRKPILELPKWGCVNVHASLLPRWRGAAPIQYAIRAGDAESGVTIMKMDVGLDTGLILAQRACRIDPTETGASLHDKLAQLGAEMLPGTLEDYINGKISPVPQLEDGVTVARTIKKDEGRIDWSQPSVAIDRQVRAYTMWPGTYSTYNGELLKIHRGEAVSSDRHEQPGEALSHNGGLAVQTGEGLYQLFEVQPAGKHRMAVSAYLSGHPEIIGAVLG